MPAIRRMRNRNDCVSADMMAEKDNFEAIAHYLRTQLFPNSDIMSQRTCLNLYRLLAQGEPVSPLVLASTMGEDDGAIRKELADIDPSRLRYDENKNIIAFAGLSQAPAPHRFLCKGHALYTWCVFDALFLPQLLGAKAMVTTVCPVTDTTISMCVTPDGPQQIEPVDTVMSFVMPDQEDLCGNLRGAFCNYVNFFASRDIGKTWRQNNPNAAILSLDAAFALGRVRNESYFKNIIHEL